MHEQFYMDRLSLGFWSLEMNPAESGDGREEVGEGGMWLMSLWVGESSSSPNMCLTKMFLRTAMPQRGVSYFHHKSCFVYPFQFGAYRTRTLLGASECHQVTKACKVENFMTLNGSAIFEHVWMLINIQGKVFLLLDDWYAGLLF